MHTTLAQYMNTVLLDSNLKHACNVHACIFMHVPSKLMHALIDMLESFASTTHTLNTGRAEKEV